MPRPVTRLEAAWMIVWAARLTPVRDPSITDLIMEQDRLVVGALLRAGVATGHSGRFMPDRALTRAEAVKMLAAIVSS